MSRTPRVLATLACVLLCAQNARAEVSYPVRSDHALRALQYVVSERIDGQRIGATVSVEITNMTADRGFGVDIREERDGGSSDAHVIVDQFGSIATPRGEWLTREEQAVLYFLSLSSQNLTGMDRGDAWKADGTLPNGHHETRYTVLRTLSGGRINLGVTRSIWMDNGETSSWRGDIVYDYQAIMPVSISLNGRVRLRGDDAVRTSDVVIQMQLRSDSFQKS
jgi:mRNA-degrading endonuclease toxin of MazEF toxin-antitoxin module